jgi:predicted metal-dependent HD superfamily phosphohydrolase
MNVGGERMSRLRAEWLDLLARLGVGEDKARRLFMRIADAYSAPARYHHNLRHIAEVLGALRSYPEPVAAADALAAAAWFHDIVYDPAVEDNEERSAEKAARELRALGVAENTVIAVRDLVMATNPDRAREPTGDAAVLVDADMSVLGADDERYDKYAQAIRSEYAIFPPDEYRSGRGDFLKALHKRESLFRSSWFREKFEARARANIAREIEHLISEGGSSECFVICIISSRTPGIS